MKTFPAMFLFVSSVMLLAAGCGDDQAEEANVTVSVGVAGQDAGEVESVTVWALAEGGVSCAGLLAGDDRPNDATTLQGPAPLEGPDGNVSWSGMSTGVVLFFAAAQDADGEEFLRGCIRRQLYPGDNQVMVPLVRVGPAVGCEQNADCDDDNDCTTDACDLGVCQNVPATDGQACEDGLVCTSGESCQGGLCTGGAVTDCSDLDRLCVRGTCLEDQGGCQAVPLPDGSDCSDGLFCTGSDFCQQGSCQGGPPACDDQDPCTDDICDEELDRCDHVDVERPGAEGPMDDATCSNGIDDDCDDLTDLADPDCSLEGCVDVSDCQDDGNDCTGTVCDLARCYHLPLDDGTPCPGSDACSSQYLCAAAVCGPGPADLDADQDGYVDDACSGGTDCDDSDPDVHPGAEGPLGDATCLNVVDDDCDGRLDGWDPSCWETVCTEGGWCWESPLPHGNAFRGVWMAAPDDVWLVGETCMHWDGGGLSIVDTGTTYSLNAVWGRAGEVWVAGWFGAVRKYDGVSWTAQDIPATRILNDIHGTDTDLWVVGQQGAIWRLDAGGWTEETLAGVTAELNAVWALASDDVWAVGRGGTILHRDAAGWSTVDSGGITTELTGVFAIENVGVWVTGDNGTILEYVDPVFTPMTTNTSRNLEDMWGVSGGVNTDLWTVGWTVLQGDGVSWQEWPDNFAVLTDIWGTSLSAIWATGYLGTLLHNDGTTWWHVTSSVVGDGSQDDVLDLWVVAEDDVWAAGTPEHLMHYDGTEWRPVPTGQPAGSYTAVYATADGSTVWATGQNGLILRYDGHTWIQDGYLPGAVYTDLHGAGDRVWATGLAGLLAVRENGSWSQVSTGVTRDLHSVWARTPSDVLVVGARGTVLRFDGSTWAPETVGAVGNDDLFCVWGSSDTDVWIAGEWGLLVHFDGTGWTEVDLGTSSDLLVVWGTGPQDVWVLGDYDSFHLDQLIWMEDAIDVSNGWTAIGGAAGHIWVVGERRFILHRAP